MHEPRSLVVSAACVDGPLTASREELRVAPKWDKEWIALVLCYHYRPIRTLRKRSPFVRGTRSVPGSITSCTISSPPDLPYGK